jgi:hypothetical protein
MTTQLRRPIVLLTVLTFFVAALLAARPSRRPEARGKPIRLAAATTIVEVNATQGDAGLQVFFDGDPWRSMRITGPDGRSRELVDIQTDGRLQQQGLTELFSESSEPPFEQLSLAEFKRRFPEGRYHFEGRTIDGQRLIGNSSLSHDIPNGPRIKFPAHGDTVDKSVVARWGPGKQPRGVEIVAYRAIFEREDPLRVLSVDLPASVTKVAVPPEFLEPGIEYLFELQAIEASGNITFSEADFVVA